METLSNIKELRAKIKSVGIAHNPSKKDVKALAQYISAEETPLLYCVSNEAKFVLTKENLYLITSRLLSSSVVKVIPLSAIKSIQEKRGFLFSKITLTSDKDVIKLSNLYKKESAETMKLMREHEQIAVLATQRPGIIESAFKLTATALLLLVLGNTCIGTKNNKPAQEITEETTVSSASNGKVAIDLNSGNIVSSKPNKKEWYEGGTLHQATVKEWRKATRQNKLATCADFVATANKENMLKFSASGMSELKSYAEELVDFIDTATDGAEKINSHKVSEIAATGFHMMKWIKQ